MSRTLLFLLALVSPFSHAFQLSDAMIDAEVRKVNSFVSADSDGIKVNVTGKGYKASAPYFQTNTVVPKPTFTSFVKGNIRTLAKRSPYYAGWLATMGAAGWAIDELHNQMTETSTKLKIGNVQCYGINGYYIGIANGADGCQQKIIDAYGAQNVHFKTPVPLPTAKEYSCLFNAPPAPNCSSLIVRFKFYNSTNSPIDGSYIIPKVSASVENVTTPVSDDMLYDSLVNNMIQNPTDANQAFMQPGAYPYPYPQLFPDPLKNIPGVSEADYPALDCYFKGNLQSSNPGAACYAPESEYQRIKAIGDKIKTGQTVDGQISNSNDELTKPLTQAQFEESLNKLSGADVNKVTDDASKIYDTGFKQLNDSILANTLPGMPDLIPLPQFQTGSCRSITLQFSFAGKNVTKQFPGDLGCVQLEKMKEFLGWLMAIAVTIGLMFAALREAN